MRKSFRLLGVVLPIVMTVIVYYSVTKNFFWADDFYDLWYLINYGAFRFVLLVHGGHSHVTRNLIIVLWHNLFGSQPAAYLWLSVLTHLVNVWLVFRLVVYLTASESIACVLAGLWGIAPMQEETVGWFAVYGEELAAACALWVLGSLARDQRGEAGSRGEIGLWGVLMVIGALSFGVGIGLALVMPVIAFVLLPSGRRRRLVVGILAFAATAAVGLYVGQQRLFEALYHEVVWSVSPQGALDQWFPKATFAAAMAAHGMVALLLGPFDTDTGISHLLGSMILALVGVLAVVAAARAPRRAGRYLLASLLVGVGAYGSTAIGRQMFITAVNEAWMIRTPRYQYLGSVAAVMVIAVVASEMTRNWRTPSWVAGAIAAICAGTALTLRLSLGPPVNHYEDALTETVGVLEHIREQVDAAPPGGDVFIVNRPFRAVAGPMRDFPGWAALFAVFSPDNIFDGHRVRFVIKDPGDLRLVQNGLRAPDLLCGPQDVPADMRPK